MSDQDRTTDLVRALTVLLGTAGAEVELDLGEIRKVATLTDGATFHLTIRQIHERSR